MKAAAIVFALWAFVVPCVVAVLLILAFLAHGTYAVALFLAFLVTAATTVLATVDFTAASGFFAPATSSGTQTKSLSGEKTHANCFDSQLDS